LKITGAEATLLFRSPGRPPGTAPSPGGPKRQLCCVVELATDEGLVGIGVGDADVRVQIRQLTGALLEREDPRGVTGLWQRMMEARVRSSQAGLLNYAIAMLDMALWDLKAKANAEPLWKTLGGSRPKVNVHAGGCELHASDEELSGWFRMMALQFGIRGGKLKVGRDPEADLRRLALMREALLERTAEPELMIDVDECWSPKEATRRVRELERQFDLSWVEEPAGRWDFPGLKRVSRSIRAAVCAGGKLETPAEFLPHLSHRALDVVEVGTRSGGITGALQVADAAFGYELPVALSASVGNVHAHLGAALPYCMSMEVVEPLAADNVFSGDVRIEEGWAVAGDRPGHGLVIDRKALARASIDAVPAGAGGSP